MPHSGRIPEPGRGMVAVLVVIAFLLSSFAVMTNAGLVEARGESATNLWQYYRDWGKSLPSISARGEIYQALGLGSASSYYGTAGQNTTLLNALKSRQIAPMSAGEIGGATQSPTVSSISPRSVEAGTFTLTVTGRNFDSGAVDKVYWAADGHYVGQGTVVSRSVPSWSCENT